MNQGKSSVNFHMFQKKFLTWNMDANDDFNGNATHLNCLYIHTIFRQKYTKLAIHAICYGPIIKGLI